MFLRRFIFKGQVLGLVLVEEYKKKVMFFKVSEKLLDLSWVGSCMGEVFRGTYLVGLV